MITIGQGDVVFHRPTRETWLVLEVDGAYLYWAGWPPGRAYLKDCLLVEKSTPGVRRWMANRELGRAVQ